MGQRGGKPILGVNYWPRRKAMSWWREFDRAEVEEDLSRMVEAGLEVMRFFLLWEDFQPEPSRINVEVLKRLVDFAEMVYEKGMRILPTFFTGHMSGVNWLPPWMLGSETKDVLFPVISSMGLGHYMVRDFYAERELQMAQVRFIREVLSALEGHPVIWGWDLGNEPSNLVQPSERIKGRDWLSRMTDEIKEMDEYHPVTLGLHQKDLEEDRGMGPEDVAMSCDLLSMHAYPFYSSWAREPLDPLFPAFLGLITRWLGGKGVILEEIGVPTRPVLRVADEMDVEALSKVRLINEEEASLYLREAMRWLYASGVEGIFFWCYADYAPEIWDGPPLDREVHERFFGLWRWDGSPKALLEGIREGNADEALRVPNEEIWIDMKKGGFYKDPMNNLKRLYRRFCDAVPG